MLIMIIGWKFRRIIIFVSWDVEEFGLLGFIEWVEVNRIGDIFIFLINRK